MTTTTLAAHPFPLDAVALNSFDHDVRVSARITSTGVAYERLDYTPRDTPGFDYARFFVHAGMGTGPVVLSYSFDADVSQVRSKLLAAGAPDFTSELSTPRLLDASERANALAALAEIERFAYIEFRRVEGAGDINYFQDPRFGVNGFARGHHDTAWSPGGEYTLDGITGIVVVGTANDPFMFRHELAHVLTLKHVGPFQFPADAPLLPERFLDSKYTIMFYDVRHADLSDPGERVNNHFQLFDVYALQQRFGANTGWRSGNDVYTAADFDGNRQVLWDGGGTDTLDFSAHASDQLIDLNDGMFSTLGGFLPPTENLSIAYGALIEHARGGSGNDRLIGNAQGNALHGGAGSDSLSGEVGRDTLNGGAGRDALEGGTGNDTYLVSRGDRITELAGGGVDTVRAMLDWTLPAQVENLVLVGAQPVDGTGNAGSNVIAGNHAANILSGLQGRDTFVFATAPGGEDTVDTITDFRSGTDRIRLDATVFTALSPGALMPQQLYSAHGATSAADADDRLVYDRASGSLYYDADGTGGVAATLIAVLGVGSHPTLAAEDIEIVA